MVLGYVQILEDAARDVVARWAAPEFERAGHVLDFLMFQLVGHADAEHDCSAYSVGNSPRQSSTSLCSKEVPILATGGSDVIESCPDARIIFSHPSSQTGEATWTSPSNSCPPSPTLSKPTSEWQIERSRKCRMTNSTRPSMPTRIPSPLS